MTEVDDDVDGACGSMKNSCIHASEQDPRRQKVYLLRVILGRKEKIRISSENLAVQWHFCNFKKLQKCH